jgi:hypothetical protein
MNKTFDDREEISEVFDAMMELLDYLRESKACHSLPGISPYIVKLGVAAKKLKVNRKKALAWGVK